MNILLLGSGGREHALAWKLQQSPLCNQLFIAPGNAGTAQCGTNLNIAVTDFDAIKNACVQYMIDLLVVGPEEPLVKGIVDVLRGNEELSRLMIIGPSKDAAQLEGSKAFAKAFMQRQGIPTAAYKEFEEESFTEGVQYIHQQKLPVVLKADGLAAGKGVIICQNHVEAVAEFELMVQQSKFGEAGHKVVIEEFLQGIELSVFVLTDGRHYVLLPEAKDYKRVGEGDTGSNTGGMGAVSPVPFADEAFMQKVVTKIIEPTICGLQKENMDYKGFIFFGLMKVEDGPFVIEYNCRLGDPETEVVLPRLKNDLVELLTATAKGTLDTVSVQQDERFAATIMAVSGGYPGVYEKGHAIIGLRQQQQDNILIFHAGTTRRDTKVITNGGRVLCVTALANTLDEAVAASREVMENIYFEGMYYRNDIGYEFGPLSPDGKAPCPPDGGT
ncbi:MAG: phosphoribosylamine--glycine ligase [Flavisolibacter sp.]|nr:phosphoribosylamine--glycine ligase [Flavisolibacter sp.]